MGRPPKHTAEEVIAAIKGTGGIKTDIAKSLNVMRHAVDRYLAKYESARQAYEDEIQEVGDIAETVIIESIRGQRNIETAKWYARMKLAGRGYVEKQQVEHSGMQNIVLTWEEPVGYAEPGGTDNSTEDAPQAGGDIPLSSEI